jgi:hypothetical protein
MLREDLEKRRYEINALIAEDNRITDQLFEKLWKLINDLAVEAEDNEAKG